MRYRAGGIGADGPEARGLGERCLLGFNSGPPLIPRAYNNIQLFQTPTYVIIYHEMVHDARVVPLDARPHLPDKIRQWMGDARGRWENDTLVVETTSLTPRGDQRVRNQLYRQDGELQPSDHECGGDRKDLNLDRAIHAGGFGYAALRIHGGRSCHLYPPLYGGYSYATF